MADCFIYDHVRTPRGRGKSDGSLHEVPPVELASTALRAVLHLERVGRVKSGGSQG